MAEEVKITKNQAAIFIDTSDGSGDVASATWSRIDKSTIFAVQMNAETEDYDYIDQELPTTELKSYKPSLDEEIQTRRNNPIYEYMVEKFYNCDTAHVRALLCWPENGKGEKKAWMVADTTITLTEANWVDGKLTWTMAFGGTPERGTYEISQGKVTYTAPDA